MSVLLVYITSSSSKYIHMCVYFSIRREQDVILSKSSFEFDYTTLIFAKIIKGDVH